MMLSLCYISFDVIIITIIVIESGLFYFKWRAILVARAGGSGSLERRKTACVAATMQA